MYLVSFIYIFSLFVIILGEFGKYPFGASGGSLSILDLGVFLVGALYVIWKISSNSKIKVNEDKFLLFFWLVGLIGLVLSFFKFPLSEVIVGGAYLFRYISYSFLIFVVRDLIKKKIIKTERIIEFFLVAGGVLSFLGILQYFLIPDFTKGPLVLSDFGYDPHFQRLTSTFLDPNYIGGFLVIIFGLGIYKLFISSNRSYLIFNQALILFAIIFTFSRSAYLMLLIVLTCLFIFIVKKIKLKQFVLGGLVILMFLTSVYFLIPRVAERVMGGVRIDRSSSERFVSWSAGIDIFKENPVIGVGFNNMRIALHNKDLFKTYSPDGGHSGSGIDSSLLLVLATTGLVGFVAFIIFWIRIFRKLLLVKTLYSQIIFSLLIALFVQSQFINALFFPSIMFLYFSLLGTVDEFS